MLRNTHNQPAKQATACSPGWSKAEPGVNSPRELRAHFSGRQKSAFFRPLKRAKRREETITQGSARFTRSTLGYTLSPASQAVEWSNPGRAHFRAAIIIFTLLITSLSASAQESPDKTNVTANSNQTEVTLAADGDSRYRMGPGDVLDIRILNRPNLSREAVRVEGSGMIRMPLIDTEIMAACKTEGELAKEIAGKYTKFYRNPQVDVFIKEYKSKQVAIIGAVNDQARFELQRRIRLLELLTYAKGPSAKAGQTINIVHSPPALTCQKPASDPEDGATAFSSYKLSETLQGLPKANPWIEAGDIITLPEAPQAYVVGNVLSPLTIPLKEPVTISRAIAMAGGLKQDSKKDKVRIVRQEPGTSTSKELIVDLSAIEKKRAEDIALLPNDIVDVPTSTGKSLLRSLLGTVVPTVSQLPIRVIP